MLYISSLELNHLITERSYPLTDMSPFLPLPNLWPPTLVLHFFLDYNINDIIQFMSFPGWLISLSIMPSSSIHVVTKGWVFFFLCGRIIFVYIFITYYLPIHLFIGSETVSILATMKSAAIKMGERTSLWDSGFISFGYIPRNWNTGS